MIHSYWFEVICSDWWSFMVIDIVSTIVVSHVIFTGIRISHDDLYKTYSSGMGKTTQFRMYSDSSDQCHSGGHWPSWHGVTSLPHEVLEKNRHYFMRRGLLRSDTVKCGIFYRHLWQFLCMFSFGFQWDQVNGSRSRISPRSIWWSPWDERSLTNGWCGEVLKWARLEKK